MKKKTIIPLILAAVMLLVAPLSALAIEIDQDPLENPIFIHGSEVYVWDFNPENPGWVYSKELSEQLQLNGDLTVTTACDQNENADQDADQNPHQDIDEKINQITNQDTDQNTDQGGAGDQVTGGKVPNMSYDAALEIMAIEGATSSFTVDGSVSHIVEDHNATGAYVHPYWAGSSELAVTGNVEAITTSEDKEVTATALYVNEAGQYADTKVDILGKVEATATSTNQNANAYAIGVEGNNENSVVKIAVDGNVTTQATTTNAQAYTIGVYADTWTGSTEVQVNVGGSIEASATALNTTDFGLANAVGIEAVAYDENSKVEVVTGGDVIATATAPKEKNAASKAVLVWNDSGIVNIAANGDVIASGGAQSFGLKIEGNEKSETSIIIDGTLSGDTAAVLLEDINMTTEKPIEIGENVTLTVWAVTPNENDEIVVRRDYDREDLEYVRDETAEAAIQYIIKVQAGLEDIIATDGTTEYAGYNVANEGDLVTMKLTIPEGYEVTGAYGDAGQQWALSQDANGQYYLTVPRGGGVMLSVQLIPKEDPGPDPGPGPDPEPVPTDEIVTLLKIRDLSGKAELSFFNTGYFMLKVSGGASEWGKYHRNDAGAIVLASSGAPDTEMPLTLNAEQGLYALAFVCAADPATTYDFEIPEASAKPLFTYAK